jgi:hypothetical protein
MNQQTDNQPLTRKQLREIRNTASNPIVAGEGPVVAPAPSVVPADAEPDPRTHDQTVAETAPEPAAPPAVPLARPAEPAPLAPAPGPDAAVDLGVAPLTRRQARQQELIRTASVPVITPDVLAAAADPQTSRDVPEADTNSADTPDEKDDVLILPEIVEAAASERPVVSPGFGSELLAGEPASMSIPASFDQLIARESAASGSIATPNALILSQGGAGAPLMSPIAATGEVLITGTFALPEGLGSQGHAPGVADGKEADAVLVDGELPAHSSPTPIAASAAISTVKTNGEIIRPPAPEKGNRLMLTLAITAGVLALALVGVLILAFATGVFR